ncbi:hypothetical protein [Nonomuraea jiangxiensis]|uniref:Antibiotic biosynthesis monooxygenase n=1 Tax=Nonomuraea jiangxiensis TaxID=633440 RepID=A0A1G9QXS2_9ACTN|nr:hypothetical protein [Nonomuraea jiangxiensis]SDM15808.1 hypothetical protein SAMN05421869_13751 [Nonomuraea jiangxiensis]
MKLMMVQAEIKPECVDEIEAAGRKLFSAIERERPQGLRYASCRLPDGVTYLNLLALDDGVENPLPALPEAGEFQAGLKGWLAEPATSRSLTIIGSYRLF